MNTLNLIAHIILGALIGAAAWDAAEFIHAHRKENR